MGLDIIAVGTWDAHVTWRQLLVGRTERLSVDPQNRNHIMLWASCTLCFFGFLRAGEITIPSEAEYDTGAHLNFEDIAINNLEKLTIMQVRIKASKTDPFRKGVELYLGRTSNELCPISAMLAYLAVRGDKSGGTKTGSS